MRSLEARCAAESQDSPLRPVADMFAAMVEPLDAMLERRGFDLAETFPPLATALSLPPDDRSSVCSSRWQGNGRWCSPSRTSTGPTRRRSS